MSTRCFLRLSSRNSAAAFLQPLLVGAATVVMLACAASTPSPHADGGAPGAATSQRSTITAAELADPAIESSDLLTAVRRLRPTFLLSRGADHSNGASGATLVYLDSRPLAPLGTLGTIRTSDVSGVEYLTVVEAAQRFGNAARSGAVIVVHLN
jgi:hypothetical protein